MGLDFPWPASQGELLAMLAAAFTTALGLLFMFAPRISLRLLRLQTAENHPEAVAEIRSTMAGIYVGSGLCCLLFAQQFLYMALGFSWLLVFFGRVISILSDRGNTIYNWLLLLVSITPAAMLLGFAFGFLP